MSHWRPCPYAPEHYSVSDEGEVQRTAGGGHGACPGKILKQGNNGKGYRSVMLCVQGRRTRRYVHRMVWEAFKGLIPTNREINHKDGNKARNVPDNLELMTTLENVRHARDVLHRRFGGRGEQHPCTRLTADDVRAIRQDHRKRVDIAREYKMTPQAVGAICLWKTWRHLKPG